jgi:zinc transport system substrate-binding protein
MQKRVGKATRLILNKTKRGRKALSSFIKGILATAIIFCCAVSVNAAPLNIVVSIAPLQALAEGILGNKGTVTEIVPANMSPHSYTLKPADLIAMSKAKAIIWVGPQLEFFLFKSIENLKSSRPVMTVIDLPGLELLQARTGVNWEGEHAHSSDYAHSTEKNTLPPSQQYSLDPHLWLNPNNAEIILKQITALVVKLDPANAAYYQNNLKMRLAELNALDKKLKTKLTPIQNKPYLVFHDGYQYFEKYYHLNDLGVVLLNSEVPLSGKQLQETRAKIERLKISCVFKEPHTNDRLADSIVHGTKARLGQLDPLDSGLVTGWQSYPGLLEKDAHALVECLR